MIAPFSILEKHCLTQLKLYTLYKLSSTIFCCLSDCQASVTLGQISTFSICTGTKAIFWVTRSILGLVPRSFFVRLCVSMLSSNSKYNCQPCRCLTIIYIIYHILYNCRCLTYVREAVQRAATKSQLQKSNLDTLLSERVSWWWCDSSRSWWRWWLWSRWWWSPCLAKGWVW